MRSVVAPEYPPVTNAAMAAFMIRACVSRLRSWVARIRVASSLGTMAGVYVTGDHWACELFPILSPVACSLLQRFSSTFGGLQLWLRYRKTPLSTNGVGLAGESPKKRPAHLNQRVLATKNPCKHWDLQAPRERNRWDLNPRWAQHPHNFSRVAPSAARTRFRGRV